MSKTQEEMKLDLPVFLVKKKKKKKPSSGLELIRKNLYVRIVFVVMRSTLNVNYT